MPDIVTHPSQQELSAFGLGKLPDAAATAIARHLETCPNCRQVVENMPDDLFLEKVRAAKPGGLPIFPIKSPLNAPTYIPPPENVPPELANHPKYRIVRELGRGGMGVVYQAVQTIMDRPIAIKVISPSVLEHVDALPRFHAEVKAAAKLDHQNIVRAHDADQVGSLHLLVMEFIEGVSLAQLVERRGPLPIANACHYVRQAALGLQHAFEQGMVHRDIKPQNLMLTRKGVVKILDFGLARLRNAGPATGGLTAIGAFMGTPEYVSPEQATDARGADTRADLYSLGCTFYFLLTGRPPFVEDTVVKLIMAQIEQEPIPLHELRPEVPPELSAVVARLLAKDPVQRYQKPVELAQALTAFIKPGANVGKAPALPPGVASPATATVMPGDTSRLGGLGKGASQLPAKKAVVAKPEPFANLEDAPIRVAKKVTKKREGKPETAPLWKRPSILAGAAVAVLALLMVGLWASGVLFKVKTKDGIIVLENLPVDAEVLVDGGIVTVKSPDGTSFEVCVESGKRHRLEVKKDGFKVFGEEVEVDTGGRQSVVVLLERPQPKPDGKDTAKRGAALVTKRFPFEIPGPEKSIWRIEGDELVQSSVDQDQLIAFGDPKWADYDFSVDAKMVEGRPGFELAFRRQTEGKLYHFALDGAIQKSNIRPTDEKWQDKTYFHDEPGQFAKDNWYHLEVRVRGQRCDAFIGGKKFFTFTADDLPPKGGVGLRTWKTSCRFRNIVVKDPKGTILLEGLPDLEEAKTPPYPPAPGTRKNDKTDNGGFVPLFNGKDLTGWETPPDDKSIWVVKDGILTSGGGPGNLFSKNGDYEDFHLRAKVRINDGGNSGLFFRSLFRKGIPPGYEAQINSSHKDVNKTGSLYITRPGEKARVIGVADTLVPPNEWFTEEVIATGKHVVIMVNGKTTVETDDDSHARGHFALQQHNPQTVVEFRKIEIKELTPSRPAEPVVLKVDPKLRRSYCNAGVWEIDGDELVQTSRQGGDCTLAFGDMAWTDYDFTCEAKKVDGRGEMGMVYRVTEAGRGEFILGRWDRTCESAGSIEGGKYERLKHRKTSEVEPDRWYKLRLRVRGTDFQCFIDKELVFDFKDAKNPKGAVGLRMYNTGARFRKLKVTDPSGNVLFEGLPELPATVVTWIPNT